MKHPYIVDRNHTALVVVDMQEKFRPAIETFDMVAQNVTKLILGFQMYQMPVLVSEQYPKGLGRTVDIIQRQFKPLEPVEKVEFACTENTEFQKRLEMLNVKTVVVCGIETHVCINQTVLGLLQREFRVQVVADATASRSEFDHEIALEKLLMAGAIPSTTEMCLFELAEKAGTESFKYIQRMVKSKQVASREENERPTVERAPASASAPEGTGKRAESSKKMQEDVAEKPAPEIEPRENKKNTGKKQKPVQQQDAPERASSSEKKNEKQEPLADKPTEQFPVIRKEEVKTTVAEEELDLESILSEPVGEQSAADQDTVELSEQDLADVKDEQAEEAPSKEQHQSSSITDQMETKAIRREYKEEKPAKKESRDEDKDDDVLDMEDILRMGRNDTRDNDSKNNDSKNNG